MSARGSNALYVYAPPWAVKASALPLKAPEHPKLLPTRSNVHRVTCLQSTISGMPCDRHVWHVDGLKDEQTVDGPLNTDLRAQPRAKYALKLEKL